MKHPLAVFLLAAALLTGAGYALLAATTPTAVAAPSVLCAKGREISRGFMTTPHGTRPMLWVYFEADTVDLTTVPHAPYWIVCQMAPDSLRGS